MEGCRLVIVCVKALCVIHCVSSIVLESSLSERQAACAGEEVVFTCTITTTGILQWEIEPPQNNFITFMITPGPLYAGSSAQDSTGHFNAIVTNFSLNPDSLGNITSSLSVVATPESVMSGKRIWCNDGISPRVSLNLILADLPSSPQNLTLNFTRYSISGYSVRVQWEAPSDDGGVGVSSYTTTVTTEGMVNRSVENTDYTSQDVSLQYNKVYMFEVAAINCNGTGQSASLSISAVGCGHPLPPANGTIETYSSTQVGAEIQFHCDEGHTPREWMTSQCQENGTWTPEPKLLNCTSVDCGPPNTTFNIIPSFTATSYNSTASYMCRKGFTPSHVYMTMCTSDEIWVPDPSILECREIENCSIPDDVSGVTFHYNNTVEGSKMTITCNEGLYLQESGVEFRCTNGSWSPDPAHQYCYEKAQEPDSSAGIVSGVVVAVVVALAGVAVACVGIMFWKRKLPKRISRATEENSYVETDLIFVGQYSELQPTQDLNGIRSTTSESIPTTAASTIAAKSLTYAEVGPHVSTKSRPPPILDGTGVQYASIWHNAVVEPLPSELLHPADKTMNLDQLLIQLQEVEQHWMALGQAAGLEEQWLQKVKSQVSSDREAMIEVVDGWMAKLYPSKPTWREVADVVEQIGHLELACSLRQVYVTGFLPIEVSNAVPSSPAMETVTAPPLPPRQPSKYSGTASPTCTTPHAEEQPPPLPPKLSRTTSTKTPTIDGN